MNVPARTVEHFAELERRFDDLKKILGESLSSRPFVWEVGCGHGHFLTAYAKNHTDRLCVGIDISAERIDRANRKRNRARLDNLLFLRAEARMFLRALPTDAQIAEIYVLFPDPWPKQRHHKHRLLEPEFFREVAKRTEKGVRLYFRTDFGPYFSEVESTLRGQAEWGPVAGPWPFETATVFQERAAKHQSLVAVRR